MHRYLALLAIFVPFGCVQRAAVRLSIPVMEDAFDAVSAEPDLELAKAAAGANLKLLEAALKSDPHNRKLLGLACRGFAGYALAFVPEKESERARGFFERARDFGFKALTRNSRYRHLVDADLDTLKVHVRKLKRNDVPELFWPTFAWGYWINLSRDKPSALSQLPRVEVLMGRLLELDESYFYGGAHLFFAVLHSSRAKALGGQPEKARMHFERAIEIADSKFLLSHYFYARYYAVITQNRDLCDELLNKVVEAPSNLLPEQQLINSVARRRADDFLIDMDDYF